MDNKDATFCFPLTRTLPLVGSFVVMLLLVASGFFVGGYHPVVTVIFWAGLVGSGWLSLSELVTRVVVKPDGLQIRWLSLLGVRTRLIYWNDIQKLDLAGHIPDVLQLEAQKDVSRGKWTLPADPALAKTIVWQALLQPHPDNQSPGVDQAFEKLQVTKRKEGRYFLRWQWRRDEKEFEDE